MAGGTRVGSCTRISGVAALAAGRPSGRRPRGCRMAETVVGRRMRAIAAICLAAGLTGCSFLSPGPVVATLPGGEGFRELPVAMTDPDGLVLRVEPGPSAAGFGSEPEVDPIDADTAVVRWLGGACDTRVRLRISTHDGDLGIGLQTDDGGSCV